MARRYRALLIAIVLGLIFVSFVYDHSTVSWGWTAFCGMLAVGLLLAVWKDAKHSFHGWLGIVAGLGIALSHGLYAQRHMTPLNVLIAPIMIIYGAWVLHFGAGPVEGLIRNYIGDFAKIFLPFGATVRYLRSLFSRDGGASATSKATTNTISGIILALIVLAVLIPILSSSDAVFAQMFSSVVNPLNEFFTWLASSDVRLDKIIIFLIVGAIALAVMVFFNSARAAKEVKGISRTIERSIFNIMARSVAVVYVLFAFIQIKYLLLGAALPEGITYSEYAVSGFRQLIGISFVNIALMLLAPHYRKGESKGLYMALLWIVFLSSMVIWASSLFRLTLYIQAYGLTFMRIMPLSFIIYLGYGLIISFAGIFYSNIQRSNMLVYGLVIRYAISQLAGVDAIIANYNIKRYVTAEIKDVVKIDVDYLITDLSADQLKAKYNLDTLKEFLVKQRGTEEMVAQIEEYKKTTR